MKKIKTLLGTLLVAVLIGSVITPVTNVYAEENVAQEEAQGFKYVHDPRLNSKAMSDIVVDPTAVYGFAPSKDSERLGSFASEDWSDPVKVEGWRQERIEYHKQFETMFTLWEQMIKEKKSTEEIARAVSKRRNEIRLESYKNDPEGLERVKQSNLETYGNENGPTPESLFEKYGSWDKVLLKSFSSNSGMDACLGLYDEQYAHNVMTGAIAESDTVVYTVVTNDYLGKIALKYYGDKNQWKKIYEANKDQIKSVNVIYEGQQFVIPLD